MGCLAGKRGVPADQCLQIGKWLYVMPEERLGSHQLILFSLFHPKPTEPSPLAKRLPHSLNKSISCSQTLSPFVFQLWVSELQLSLHCFRLLGLGLLMRSSERPSFGSSEAGTGTDQASPSPFGSLWLGELLATDRL